MTDKVALMSHDPEVAFPPDEFLEACVQHYRRPSRNHRKFAHHRRAGRSFPTDYVTEVPGETEAQAWDRIATELDAYRGRGPRLYFSRRGVRLGDSQVRQSVAADKRVFAGPSDADVEALPRIEPAWCVAEFMCAELGLRADTWTRGGLRLAHVRYGMMLDWLTRDVAARMARTRDSLPIEDAWKRYGLDPWRVAMEHGAVPDELDERAASTGLYERGALAPLGRAKDHPYLHQRIEPEADPGFRAIAALKKRIGEEFLRGQG